MLGLYSVMDCLVKCHSRFVSTTLLSGLRSRLRYAPTISEPVPFLKLRCAAAPPGSARARRAWRQASGRARLRFRGNGGRRAGSLRVCLRLGRANGWFRRRTTRRGVILPHMNMRQLIYAYANISLRPCAFGLKNPVSGFALKRPNTRSCVNAP